MSVSYKDYIEKLIVKGINPNLIEMSDVLRLCTEDEETCSYDFNTDNIVSGPMGELIKIDYKNNKAIVYYTDIEDVYSFFEVDLTTGSVIGEIGDLDDLFDDQIFSQERNIFTDRLFLGSELYDLIKNKEKYDYSSVYRTVSKDYLQDEINVRKKQNELSRLKLPKLKKKLEPFLNDFYCHDAVRRIIDKIDNAFEYKEDKEFKSIELDDEMTEIIALKVKRDSLKKESEMFARIDAFPLVDLMLEYKAYNSPKTDKIASKITKVYNEVYSILNNYFNYRIDLINNEEEFSNQNSLKSKHTLLLLKRFNEIEKANNNGYNGGFYE